jgi:isopenicillin N synthase-like dioxygenase
MNVPIVDLAGTFSSDPRDRLAVAAAIREPSCELGMFYVKNHGVDPATIADHAALARSFFGLELAEKRTIDVARSDSFRGYVPFATQTIDAAAPGDLKEGFVMGPDFAPDHPHALARFPNTGTNQWPQRPPHFRERIHAYVAAMNDLGRRMARVLALSLDLPEAYFAPALGDPLTYLQLLHYPSTPPDASLSRFGAGAHVDWGLLTLLLQDDVGGLQLRSDAGRWHDAAPEPGTFVIILGEMILRLTNGRYRSARHRVVQNASGRGRYATATFFDPPYDYRVACVPTCLPPHGEPQYPPRTVGEHMLEMAGATLSGARPEKKSAPAGASNGPG